MCARVEHLGDPSIGRRKRPVGSLASKTTPPPARRMGAASAGPLQRDFGRWRRSGRRRPQVRRGSTRASERTAARPPASRRAPTTRDPGSAGPAPSGRRGRAGRARVPGRGARVVGRAATSRGWGQTRGGSPRRPGGPGPGRGARRRGKESEEGSHPWATTEGSRPVDPRMASKESSPSSGSGSPPGPSPWRTDFLGLGAPLRRW